MQAKSWQRTAFQLFNYLFLITISILCVLPLVHILAISFSSSAAVSAGEVAFWPVDMTLKSYSFILDNPKFLTSVGITLQRVVFGTIINLVLVVLTAYPLSIEEVVLGRRERHYFDGMNQHNPHIRYWNGTYYLYYMGTTYGGPVPGSGDHVSSERGTEVWNNKRIGLATSPSIAGPWTRMEQPLLEPRRGRWDCTATTNPSVAILADGTTYMIYKSREYASSTLQLGVAVADHPAGPFRRLSDDPILQFSNPDLHVEDPYLWHDGQQFHLLIKDDFKNDSSGLTGEWGAGVYATSADCLHWTICPEPKAYSRTVVWNDGSVKEMCNLERPFLLIEDGVPTHLFAATGTGEKAWHFDHTWNMVIPLAPPEPAVRD